MRWPIYLLGVIWLALGVSIVIRPEIIKKMIDFIDGLKLRIYSVGVLRLVLGILLIASSAQSRLYGFVITLGILIVLGGIGCFAIPFEKLTKMIAWYRDRSLAVCRIIGIFILILGSVLLFAC